MQYEELMGNSSGLGICLWKRCSVSSHCLLLPIPTPIYPLSVYERVGYNSPCALVRENGSCSLSALLVSAPYPLLSINSLLQLSTETRFSKVTEELHVYWTLLRHNPPRICLQHLPHQQTSHDPKRKKVSWLAFCSQKPRDAHGLLNTS